MILITIGNETPELALIRALRDTIGPDAPISVHGSLKSGNVRIEIDHDKLTPAQERAVENGMKKMLHMYGADVVISIE